MADNASDPKQEQGFCLSTEDRTRIRAEEIFRDEARRQIAGSTAPRRLHQRLWASRNSAFTLWLLSSVVLAALSWSYARWESARIAHRQADIEFREVATQAAERVNELQGVITAQRSRIQQFVDAKVRALHRLYSSDAMFRVADEAQKSSAKAKINLGLLRRQMQDASNAADRIFFMWVRLAQGDDAKTRASYLEKLSERKKHLFKDADKALAQRTKPSFAVLRDAIGLEVRMRKYAKEMDSLANTVSRNTANIKAAAKGFTFLPKTWIGSTALPRWSGIDRPIMADLAAAYSQGASVRMRLGGSEKFITRISLADIANKAVRKKVAFALIQLELAHARLKVAYAERLGAREAAMDESSDRLLDTIRNAEELANAVSHEADELESGNWSRGLSEIPTLTQRLGQQVKYFFALNDEVPDDVVRLEKDAQADMIASRTHLRDLLESKN